MKHFVLTLALFFLVQASSASHYMGGSVSYEHLGACIYRIYGTAYFDCAGGATQVPVTPTGMPIGPSYEFTIYPRACTIQPILPTVVTPLTAILYQEVTPICPNAVPPGQYPLTECTGSVSYSIFPGVAEFKFYLDYDFCGTSCDSFDIWMDGCCRNGNSTLMSASTNNSFRVRTSMKIDSFASNSSPFFNQMPQVYICLGNTTYADISATDIDGDSLVYRLEHCYGTTFTSYVPAIYLPTYSPQQPMGPNWQVEIDAYTGLLTVTPNLNGSIEEGLICIAVDEYRDGVHIGTINREFQVTVSDCNNFPNQIPVGDTIFSVGGPGIIAGGATDTFLVAPGDTLRIAVAFNDPDIGDSISVYPITGDMIGYTWTNTFNNPSYGVFEWVVDSSFLGEVVPLVFLAEDNHCLLPSFGSSQCYVRMVEYALQAVVTPAACGDSIGAVDLYVSGGVAPYTYQWNNGATSQDIDELLPGHYNVIVTDANNNTITANYLVLGVDFALQDSLFEASCNYGNDGWIKIVPQSSNAPFTYQWSDGQSTDSAINLSAGIHSVLVTDALGCVNQWVGNLLPPDSCHVYVSGTLYYDANSNCLKDSGEAPLPFVIVDIDPGGAVMSNAFGQYFLALDTGAYSLSANSTSYANLNCPVSGKHTLVFDDFDADTSGIDFGFSISPTVDFALSYYSVQNPSPGNGRHHYLSVRNYSNVAEEGVIEIQFDHLESITSSISYPLVFADSSMGLFRWQIPQINPSGLFSLLVSSQVSTSAVVGDTLYSEANVSPFSPDDENDNNGAQLRLEVLAPFDPNDILVSPKGQLAQGYISTNDSILTYTIRFQNIGTAPAQLVVIRDTIDPDLDALGFQALGFSFPYQLQIEDDSILVFSFPGINLQDSTSDPVGSQGFVQYTLPHRGTLSPFTEITNRAGIYFDYNDPVITNTALNTIYDFPEVVIREDTLCSGELLFAELLVPGVAPYDFEWSTGDQGTELPIGAFGTVANATGWYSLAVADSNGFETIDSVYIIVSGQSPIADFSVTQGGLNIDFADLSQEGLIYQWDFGDGTTSQDSLPSHVYAASGLYDVQLIVQNACGADTIIKTLSVIATDLEDEFKRSVTTVPNPFHDKTEIHFSNPLGDVYRLKLYDSTGKLVRTYAASRGTRFIIERDDLSVGMYVFSLEGERFYTGKFMIQ